jgi:hypothetical protein
MTHTHMPVAVAALELGQPVTLQATSPTGTTYESPFGRAQRHVGRRGSGEAELRAALDRFRRQRGA